MAEGGAAADAEAALQHQPHSATIMHNLACVYAQAAARAEVDGTNREGAACAEPWRIRAVEVLRQGLLILPPQERRSFWQTKVLTDAALAPIRDTAEFQQLGKEYGRSGP